MRRVDIAVDASRADRTVKTGTEWYSTEVIGALAELDDRPDLTLYHRTRSGEWLDRPGVRHRLVRPGRLWTHVGLSLAMLRDRPSALFVPSHVIPLYHPAPSIVTIHDLGYLEEPASHTRRSRMMLDVTTRWNVRSSRRIIAISTRTRDDLIRHYRADPGRVRVIHSAVNHARFRRFDPTAALAALQISRPYLLFISTIQPRKNLIRLVEAFESLERADLHLVIAGRSGWMSDRIERRIRESSASDRIVRLGHVPDETVPALYNGAQAFVLPSLYEGFGLGVLEAMACGCPVVASNVSSLPEIVGGAGILIDPLDVGSIRAGIARALHPSTRTELIEAGIRRAAGFTWERTARETLSVIEEAVRDR